MRYYNIDVDNTVVIGDSYNDSSMYEVGNVGVAPANAEPYIKQLSTVVMKQTNKEGAVGFKGNLPKSIPTLNLVA